MNRAFSASLHCNHRDTVISATNAVLQPGNYCGGVHITDKSVVELLPGLYRFLDSPLIVDNHSKILGKYVTLQLSGRKSHLNFTMPQLLI